MRLNSTALALAMVAAAALAACLPHPKDWGSVDVLHQPPPKPELKLGEAPIGQDLYRAAVQWGIDWFRSETFGNERSVTDVAGLMNGIVEVPCDPPSPPGCYRQDLVIKYFAQALDALDGVKGNLFQGNGGPDGNGYTSDLVIEFPEGSRLYGGIPVPTRLHTGLDVEAGSPLPLGIVAVPAPPADANLAYLPDPSSLGVGAVPKGSMFAGRVRFGLTCALCHFSLDIDWDGKADLKSASRPTPGSPYQPQHAWAMGNQDLHFGWLFSLSRNPLLGLTVLSGPIGANGADDAKRLVRWAIDNYRSAPQAVMRQVALGMLVQPRGYADDTPDCRHDPVQLPSLYTQWAWPYNYDGALMNGSDRNNSVWTAALDFTGLIGLCQERSSAGRTALYWEPYSIYYELPCELQADIMTRYSPAAQTYPAMRRVLMDDILGYSDGVPGMLDPSSVVVMEGSSGVLPPEVYNHPSNVANHRQRTASDYPGDAVRRGAGVMALLGTRVRTPDAIRKSIGLDQIVHDNPSINADEFLTDSVSLMLNSLQPPPNLSPLLVGQWELIQRGYAIFRARGCENCHRGPFLTDNVVHPIFDDPADELGIAAPSTAGWRFPLRDLGPTLHSGPDRALGSRAQQIFVAPGYEPATGQATNDGWPCRPFGADGLCRGLFSARYVGYKTVILRNLWASPPYLHDGGVGVGLPWGGPTQRDLRSLLRRAGGADLSYGMGPILNKREQDPQHPPTRADAALSLQALLLRGEREHVLRENRRRNVTVPSGGILGETDQSPPDELISMASLGVLGAGHEFYIDDVPGGDEVTALVAFLLSLDDRPCELPDGNGGQTSAHCSPSN